MARISDETIRDVGASAPVDPLLGTVIDSYRVESIIGRGAMGIVYRGHHTVIGKPAAIKVLKLDFAGDEEMFERLVREARTINSIRHPAIVNAFGFGTVERTNQPYILMDLLVGEPLDTFIVREAPVTLKVAAGLLDELLGVLSAAHDAGVIHRDLKPGNCFLEAQAGGHRTLRLLDFGLARQADRAGGSIRPTNPGTLLGTPAFMAPEQVLGEKVTPATDLYAVGGIAYQLLTGHLPHEAPSAIDVLTQKMKFDPVRPKQWNNRLPDEVDQWVMSLLARDPEDRERDADMVRRRLRKVMEPPTLVAMQSTPIITAAAGIVPKGDWGTTRTVVIENTDAPETRTDDHISPWEQTSVDLDGSEPTAEPTTSPFQQLPKQPSGGDTTPPVHRHGIDRTTNQRRPLLEVVDLPAKDEPTIPPVRRPPPLPKHLVGILITLIVVLCACLVWILTH